MSHATKAISSVNGPIAVTGSTGFIGSWVVHDFVDQGYTVHACVTVADTMRYRVTDFPAGASRLTQGSVGYRTTLVNGQPHVIDGELTGDRAGKVLRHCDTAKKSAHRGWNR